MAVASLFQVNDIRIEGLQRVSAGTVFSALPINVGDDIDQTAIRAASRSYLQLDYFRYVIAKRIKFGILLTERFVISEIILREIK